MRYFFRFIDVFEHGALALLLLLTFADVGVFERLLDLSHVAHRVQVIGEVTRKQWLRHGLLAKLHLD